MTVSFAYDKKLVIQALRYHFLTRPEIRIMIILVNMFALFSAVLFYLRLIDALAFLMASTMWMVLMITFWFVLPMAVYRRAGTFQDEFRMDFDEHDFTVSSGHSQRIYAWGKVKKWIETPHFFHLYFDSRSFFLVPKYAYDTTDEVYKMRQLLKAKSVRGKII